MEIEFGHFMFPAITDSLNIVDPALLKLAQDEFGIRFVQGCYWGED